MTTETRISRQEIDKLTIRDIVDDERVKNRFVELYNARSRTTEGVSQFIRTTESFMRSISEDSNLQQCTTLSLYNAFLDAAFYGVDVAKETKPLAYLLWNNVNVGTKQSPKYEKRATLSISPYGELAIRQMMGQIKHADDPVIVYEGDDYSGIYYKNGQKIVDYKRDPKRKSTTIVAAFLKITRLDGTVDYSEIDTNGIERLKGYSLRKNSRGNSEGSANALYSSNKGQIDEGFLKAKLIKHAFSSYPKVYNKNSNAQFLTEVEDVEDIYGVEEDEQPQPHVEDVEPEDMQEQNNTESF